MIKIVSCIGSDSVSSSAEAAVHHTSMHSLLGRVAVGAALSCLKL